MPLDHWFAFALASAVVLAIPGPTVLLVVSYALGRGWRQAAAVIGGVALGDLAAMSASLVGLGALLSASAAVFTALRWAGGAYLVYLGVKLWRAPVAEAPDAKTASASATRMFAHAFAVTELNPKSLTFFVAFAPQFLSPAAPYWPQAAILVATFVTLAILNSAAYAALASTARRGLPRPGARRLAARVGGAALIGAGAWAAVGRQA